MVKADGIDDDTDDNALSLYPMNYKLPCLQLYPRVQSRF